MNFGILVMPQHLRTDPPERRFHKVLRVLDLMGAHVLPPFHRKYGCDGDVRPR